MIYFKEATRANTVMRNYHNPAVQVAEYNCTNLYILTLFSFPGSIRFVKINSLEKTGADSEPSGSRFCSLVLNVGLFHLSSFVSRHKSSVARLHS